MTHPITPPTELMQAWAAFVEKYGIADVFTTAAQWGADQELEACCKAICNSATDFSAAAFLEVQRRSDSLRAARRPKPPSLKEQALADFDWLIGRTLGRPEFDKRSERIRQALEQLDD